MVEAIASLNPEDDGMNEKTNEKTISRRDMVGGGFTASAGFLTTGLLPTAHGILPATPRIRIGQIGTSHPHAAGKLAAIRGLDDIFELVGVVEPNEVQRKKIADKVKEFQAIKKNIEEQEAKRVEAMKNRIVSAGIKKTDDATEKQLKVVSDEYTDLDEFLDNVMFEEMLNPGL